MALNGIPENFGINEVVPALDRSNSQGDGSTDGDLSIHPSRHNTSQQEVFADNNMVSIHGDMVRPCYFET